MDADEHQRSLELVFQTSEASRSKPLILTYQSIVSQQTIRKLIGEGNQFIDLF